MLTIRTIGAALMAAAMPILPLPAMAQATPPSVPAPSPPAPVAPAYAQPLPEPLSVPVRPRIHRGFYMRMGLGVGGMNATGTFQPDVGIRDFSVGGSGFFVDFSFGGSPVPGLALGVDLLALNVASPTVSANGVSEDIDQSVTFGMFGPMVEWFPNPAQGFHVGGSFGLANMTLTDEPSRTKIVERGWGASARLGYDYWVSHEWSVGVSGRFFGGSVSGTSQVQTSQMQTLSVTETDAILGGGVMFTGLFY